MQGQPPNACLKYIKAHWKYLCQHQERRERSCSLVASLQVPVVWHWPSRPEARLPVLTNGDLGGFVPAHATDRASQEDERWWVVAQAEKASGVRLFQVSSTEASSTEISSGELRVGVPLPDQQQGTRLLASSPGASIVTDVVVQPQFWPPPAPSWPALPIPALLPALTPRVQPPAEEAVKLPFPQIRRVRAASPGWSAAQQFPSQSPSLLRSCRETANC